jgi:hypothetical protein
VFTRYVEAELAVLLSVADVCQNHVSPAGGVPLLVKVTPVVIHCGELEVGFAGLAGKRTTAPFRLTLSFNQLVVEPFEAPIKYKRKVTAPRLVKSAAGRDTEVVCNVVVEVPVAISAA